MQIDIIHPKKVGILTPKHFACLMISLSKSFQKSSEKLDIVKPIIFSLRPPQRCTCLSELLEQKTRNKKRRSHIHYQSISDSFIMNRRKKSRRMITLSVDMLLFHGDRWELCNPTSLCFFEGPEGGIGFAFGNNPKKSCAEFLDLGFTFKTWLRPASWVWLTTTIKSKNHSTRTRFPLPISPNFKINLKKKKKERKQ